MSGFELDLDHMLIARGPRWSLANELAFLGGELAHVQVFADRKVARWLTLADTLFLQPTGEQLAWPVYLTLNQTTPVGRRAPFVWGGGNWVRDVDVSHYRLVPFDCDPVRSNGNKDCPTTQAELESGARAALETLRWLEDAGCPSGAIGVLCSGNGFWVWLRCTIAATPSGTALVHGMLQRWAAALGSPDVVCDRGNYDPRRIGPYLGLTKRKGEETHDRPYRRSYWIAGEGSVVLTARDVRELLRRVGGTPAPVVARTTGYEPGLTEGALEAIGYERVFRALGISPKHCLWCGHTAPENSTTVEILGGVLQSCLRGSCRSEGHNVRPLARIISMRLHGDDCWRDHETSIREWITNNFGTSFPEDDEWLCI